MNELFEFSASPGTSVEGTTETWKVLSVEDDQSYQDVIALALANFTFMGKKIELIKANSAAQAATVLSRHRDISLILLDIIMETDDAGFYLIDTVRNILGDSLVRIVLLTGQPGINP
ncbi:MAG: response regulator, partial [Gammaproteobacteria bacterium]|nr:response regulator [Gammaproteobacteria bacterium]